MANMLALSLIGQRYGRLLVIERAPNAHPGKVKRQRSAWRCICNCGQEVVVRGYSLTGGTTKSCGCYSRDASAARKLKHGHARRGAVAAEFDIWCGMKQRCYDPNCQAYLYYGGQGIKICERWLADFQNFLTDMGSRPSSSHSIERNDVLGDYGPTNCRWATRKEQMRNTRRSVFLTHSNGERRVLAEWAELSGHSPDRLRRRIYRHGWSLERAMTTPALPTGRPRDSGTVA